MKNATEVQVVYGQSRNGANSFIRHPLARRLVYSDGVYELAEVAGCYWLLDIIGTEFVPTYEKQADGRMAIIRMKVENDAAVIEMELEDDAPPVYVRKIEFTDFPTGTWTFYMQVEDHGSVLILPSEY